MADKTLRIIFSGICTLTPGPPRNGKKPPDKTNTKMPADEANSKKASEKAFIIMPANIEKEHEGEKEKQVNDWGATIPDHSPFVHVARSLLVDPPWPSETVVVCEGGEHFIYYFRNARVVIDLPDRLETGIKYFIDPKERPLADRPGSLDVAPANDIRWLADIRDILSEPAPLKSTADPAADNFGSEVAAVVELETGTLQANFPCDTVHPKTFIDVKGNAIHGLPRVLADELIVDILYPEKTEEVTIRFKELRKDTPVTGPQKDHLVLKWPKHKTTIELRMGNDPEDEVRVLDTPERFDPVRRIGPVLRPRSEDFDLHYNLLDIAVGKRVVPQNDIHQCRADDCKPVALADATSGGDR
ncbi:MAG: hypothetical protein QOK37_2596 [Thermoanaerobaculia bacterium]|jgi:hypothetical protein|nr:hypothetical protein [Thermoanaerobaculia bacterium]